MALREHEHDPIRLDAEENVKGVTQRSIENL